MLQDLSMILFTYNRAHMLPEIIEYHAHTGIRLFIMDSSDSQSDINILTDKFTNVSYHYMPSSHLDRMQYALKYVTTPFVVFRADRRHQSNSCLLKCTSFLKLHQDYSSASGQWFEEKNLRPYYLSELIGKSGELSDPIQRCEKQALAYQPPSYNVHRTAIAKAFADILCKITKTTNNIYFTEYAHSLFLFLCGKTKQFECLGGIVQNALKHIDYTSEWKNVAKLLEDKCVEDTLYEAYSQHSALFHLENAPLREVIKRFFSAFTLRLLINNISSDYIMRHKPKIFSHFEEIFEILNGKYSTTNTELLHNMLRTLAVFAFERHTEYKDVAYMLSAEDLCEQNNLLTIIDSCNKQKILSEIKAAKKCLLLQKKLKVCHHV